MLSALHGVKLNCTSWTEYDLHHTKLMSSVILSMTDVVKLCTRALGTLASIINLSKSGFCTVVGRGTQMTHMLLFF